MSMNAESSAFKDELDRLKSKYRKEALRAVSAASADAYEKGKMEAREQFERDVGRWKAVAEAVQSNDLGHSKPTLLVQHVVEQVYRDMKQDFSDTKELSMAKIKAILLSSTHKLMADMPAVVLASSTKPAAADEIAAIPAALAHHITSSPQSSPSDQVSPRKRLPSAGQRARYLLHARDKPPKQFVSVQIADVSGNVVKGIFVDGQFASYNIIVAIESLTCDARPLRCQRVEKRASDVKALRVQLCKELPRAAIPSVPNRNYKIAAFARNPKRPKKPEQKVQYRRRLYALWLQYVSNLQEVRTSPALAHFLVGSDRLLEEDGAPSQPSLELWHGAPAVSNATLFTALFADAQRGRVGLRASESAQRAETAAFLADKLDGDGDSGATWGSSHLIDNPYLPPQQDVEPPQESPHRHIFAVQSAALRDLRTVERDLSQLHSAAAGAVAACRALVESCCAFNAEMDDLLGELSAWQQLEPADSLEYAALDAVSARAPESVAVAERVGEGLQCAIMEPAEFLYGDCVQTAKEGLDSVVRAYPPASFLSEQPYYCASSEGGAHGKSATTGLSSLQRTQEGVAAAVAIARGWDTSRHVRGTMFLQTLLRAASSVSAEHGRARVIWEGARATLVQINVATGGEGEEGAAFDRAASYASNSEPIVPALQGASSSLKLAIQSELGGIARPHDVERSSFIARTSESAANGGETTTWRKASAPQPTPIHQDFGESSANSLAKNPGATQKGLTALKSFKAIISRAIMPTGKRRSPSVCRPAPPLLPSEEDAIAALYNEQHAAEDNSGSSKTGIGAGNGKPQAGEADSLLQQDQRQARLAARRQATAQAGGGHVTSKIKTSSSVQAVAQAPNADAFSAAPRPAAAVVSHAVYTTPADLPAATPAPVKPDPGAPGIPPTAVPASPAVSRSAQEHAPSRSAKSMPSAASDTRGAQTPSPSTQPPVVSSPRSTNARAAAAHTEQSPPAAAPMPSGWVEVEAEGGEIYYYHSVTRVSRWDRPNEEVAAALEARIQQANAQVDDAVQKHKEERLREQERRDERDAQIEKLRAQVKDRVDKWAYGRALGMVAPKVVSGAAVAAPATRDLVLLLCSLHTLIPYIPGPDAILNAASVPQPPSAGTCPPSEIKKAYMRAVRFVHPDKLPDDASVETQLVAEAVFIILTDAFNKFRAGFRVCPIRFLFFMVALFCGNHTWPKGMSSTISAAANLAKLCIGVGVLALPYATSVGGLIFAPIIIAVVAVWNAVACNMMVECKNACTGHVFPSHLSSTYSKIAYAGAGSFGVAVTDFSIIVTLLGVCIAYQITFAQLLQEVPWTNFSTSTLTVLSGILVLPLCCVPNIGVLGVFSLIGLVCLITSVVAILVYGVLLYGSAVLESPFGAGAGGADDHLTGIVSDAHAHLPLWPETLSSMTSFIGVATFCFGLCSLAFPVEESMRDKRQFATAVGWSLLFVWFVYVLLGDAGAILYVQSAVGIKDNILSNLPTDSFVALLVRLAMTGVSLLTYPLTLVPPAQMIEHYVLTCTLPAAAQQPADAESGPSSRYGAVELANIADSATVDNSSESTPLRGSDADLAATDRAHRSAGDNLYSRVLTRGLIVCGTTLIATLIPCFGMVIALLGGFTVTILSFILPSYLHLQIIGYQHITGSRSTTKGAHSEQDRSDIIRTDIFLTVGGTLLCVVATAVTTIGFLSRVGSSGGQCT